MKSHDRQAKTHEERALVLASLPQTLLEAAITHHAKAQNTEWLHTMLDMGLFDFSDRGHELENLNSFFEFLKTSGNPHVEEDPHYGRLAVGAFVLTLPSSATFKTFFEYLCTRMCEESEKISINAKVFAKAVIAASALDLPETCKELLKAMPRAVHAYLCVDVLGRVLDDFVAPEKSGLNPSSGLKYNVRHSSREFLPNFFAMQFSNLKCMNAIDRVAASIEKTKEPWRDKPGLDSIFNQNLGVILLPACLPSALETILRENIKVYDGLVGDERTAHRSQIVESVQAMLGHGDLARALKPYLVAFEKAGVFEVDPSASVMAACIGGHPAVIQSIKGPLDWEVVKTSPVLNEMLMSNWQANNESRSLKLDNSDAAIATLLQRALDEARADVVLNMTERHARRMIVVGMDQSFLKMLHAGVNTQEKPTQGDKTLLMLADEFNPDLATTMRSFNARSLAMGLIHDIESDASNSKTLTRP